ncbi:MAG TPA: lanthionine synthetase LanC family protein [Bacteroidia bacterium]|nr:lanthionine synthetase LanC family protein [Bacteroidia bacterium]HRG53469.1 lanthionine synthetase LanC family protein [Bacteroidia bacterium]
MEFKQQVIAKVEEIYPLVIQFIEQKQLPEYPISIFEGHPGAALFLYQYAQYKPESKAKCFELINFIIDNAFEFIAETPDVRTSYCDGIIGILWLTQFFRNEGVIDMEAEETEEDILNELSQHSIFQTVNQLNCDFLHGGFGFWAFLLEFKDLPGKEKFLKAQLDALHAITIKTEHGYNWKIDLDIFQKDQENKIEINRTTSTHLGLAHGISIIIVLLAKTKLQGYFKEEIDELIYKGMSHIQSLKFLEPTTSLYPMVVVNAKSEKGGRLAWCNGDLCVAQAYWFAWKATDQLKFKEEALQIMNLATSIDEKYAGALDAGICHGTAGIAQLFKRFFWETNDEKYLRSSDQWIQATLEMAVYKDGYAGYKTYSSEAYGGPRLEYGFLSGICGIGSVLLSSLSDKPTVWDRVLQIC